MAQRPTSAEIALRERNAAKRRAEDVARDRFSSSLCLTTGGGVCHVCSPCMGEGARHRALCGLTIRPDYVQPWDEDADVCEGCLPFLAWAASLNSNFEPEKVSNRHGR